MHLTAEPGVPLYRWPPPAVVAAEIRPRWRSRHEQGRTAALLTYATGKAQRLLALLGVPQGVVFAHGAVDRFILLHRGGGRDACVNAESGGGVCETLSRACTVAGTSLRALHAVVPHKGSPSHRVSLRLDADQECPPPPRRRPGLRHFGSCRLAGLCADGRRVGRGVDGPDAWIR